MKKVVLFLITVVTFVYSLNVSATADSEHSNDERILPAEQWFFGVSLGYGKIENYIQTRDDISLIAIPDIRYLGKNLSIENLNVSYSLHESQRHVFNVIGRQNLLGLMFPGSHRDFSAQFSSHSSSHFILPIDEVARPEVEIEHRSLSYMGGVEYNYYGFVDAMLSASQDISNVHHGFVLKAALYQAAKFDEFAIQLELGASYFSADVNQYYFAVEYDEGFELFNYSPDAALNLHVKIDAMYPINQHMYLVSSYKLEKLDSEIYNSPIVTEEYTQTYFLGMKFVY
ncbi:hypothetical protein E2K93_13240 [Thalassotalea sp. HSM 43]|uniref:MipA/OmpV family protein n=1 Tax=Thalassotalea sp. HSM 43 TaxID=2552945 RepID=UPI0010819915|nr:MipA/OmpV family protein [Thalassotalea sp. HSM 43]QBY05280.1 hypothetical protein E2K93_13240 [Thalassotalea sp. HSM 43]